MRETEPGALRVRTDPEISPVRLPGASEGPPVVLDMPAPPSVNRTRRVHWQGHRRLREWHVEANVAALLHKWPRRRLINRFHLHIQVPDDRGADLDNLKAIADYLRRIDMIVDDSRMHMRRLTVEVDPAISAGSVRVSVIPINPTGDENGIGGQVPSSS